jgi:hypothetical protein
MTKTIDKKAVVVVEPHADDAYLSCHQHISDWIKQDIYVAIVTVFSGTRKRARDGANYAEAVGSEWIGLGFDEFAPEEIRDSYLKKPFDPTIINGIVPMYEEEDIRVIGPLGIQNPDHKNVNIWLKDSLASLEYYVEIPYYTKLKNNDEVNSLMTGKKVVSIRKPRHYKGDEKYWQSFKDQAKFFHFNPPESYVGIPEIILGD